MRVAVALFALAAAAPGHAGSQLVLEDGRVVEGVSIERDGENYLLNLESGGVLTFPAALVKEVRLVEVGVPEKTLGVTYGGPDVLAGERVEPPRTADQLEVLGEPSRFQKGVIDPTWTPTSDWSNDPAQNNFNPARWAKAPIDPTWVPTSAFDTSKDVLESSRSTWQDGVIDNSWKPEDGFKKRR